MWVALCSSVDGWVGGECLAETLAPVFVASPGRKGERAERGPLGIIPRVSGGLSLSEGG